VTDSPQDTTTLQEGDRVSHPTLGEGRIPDDGVSVPVDIDAETVVVHFDQAGIRWVPIDRLSKVESEGEQSYRAIHSIFGEGLVTKVDRNNQVATFERGVPPNRIAVPVSLSLLTKIETSEPANFEPWHEAVYEIIRTFNMDARSNGLAWRTAQAAVEAERSLVASPLEHGEAQNPTDQERWMRFYAVMRGGNGAYDDWSDGVDALFQLIIEGCEPIPINEGGFGDIPDVCERLQLRQADLDFIDNSLERGR
jgi:hypothetical protein